MPRVCIYGFGGAGGHSNHPHHHHHAGVGHFKTLFELSGPAASMMKTLTPTQLSIVVESLGKAGAKDLVFFGLVSSQVGGTSTPAECVAVYSCDWGSVDGERLCLGSCQQPGVWGNHAAVCCCHQLSL